MEPDFEPVRERRRKARVKLSCFILVRPFEPDPEYFESIILTDDSCRDGLSFETDNALYCQRMRLLVTFPVLRRNLTEWPFYAAFRKTTNSVFCTAMR